MSVRARDAQAIERYCVGALAAVGCLARAGRMWKALWFECVCVCIGALLVCAKKRAHMRLKIYTFNDVLRILFLSSYTRKVCAY